MFPEESPFQLPPAALSPTKPLEAVFSNTHLDPKLPPYGRLGAGRRVSPQIPEQGPKFSSQTTSPSETQLDEEEYLLKLLTERLAYQENRAKAGVKPLTDCDYEADIDTDGPTPTRKRRVKAKARLECQKLNSILEKEFNNKFDQPRNRGTAPQPLSLPNFFGPVEQQQVLKGHPPLFQAFEKGDQARTFELVCQMPASTLSIPDNSGHTALYRAIRKDYRKVCLAIVRKEAGINTKSPQGTPPLISAIRRSNGRVALALINHGADVTQRDARNRTALWWTTNNDSWQVGLQLVATMNQIDLRTPDQNGETPLTFAISKRQPDIAKAIIARLPMEDLLARNSRGETPLLLAKRHKQHFVVAALHTQQMMFD